MRSYGLAIYSMRLGVSHKHKLIRTEHTVAFKIYSGVPPEKNPLYIISYHNH